MVGTREGVYPKGKDRGMQHGDKGHRHLPVLQYSTISYTENGYLHNHTTTPFLPQLTVYHIGESRAGLDFTMSDFFWPN